MWLASLRTFYRSLHVVGIVDPAVVPSSEARLILERHSASIVPLVPTLPHVGLDPEREEEHDHLLRMPSRRRFEWARELEASEATQASFESARDVRVLTWMGKAIEWLVGGGGEGREAKEVEFGRAARDEEEGKEKGDEELRRWSPAVHRPSLDEVNFSPPAPQAASVAPASFPVAPPLALVFQHHHQNPASGRFQPTGSSGSSKGQRVFLRMSNGRLVRKLSTIASLGGEGSEVGPDLRPPRMASRSGHGQERSEVMVWDEEGETWKAGRLGKDGSVGV